MVDDAEESGKRRGLETEMSGLAGGTQRWRAMPREDRNAQGIPLGTLAVSNVRAKKRTASKHEARRTDEKSGTPACTIGWSEAVHQKIIGRTVTIGGSGLVRGGFFGRSVHGERPLLDEPASEIRGSVFFEPLIEQGGDFLAQIGGVSEAGKFIRLERIAGSGEKEFPGGLGTGLRHDNLQRVAKQEYGVNNNRTVIDKSSGVGVTGVWKAVEKQENSSDCCSGCAGDYEDPDWTAWEPDTAEDEEVSGGEVDGSREPDRRS